MHIICNGETREVAAGTTVAGLITGLGLDPAAVVAEVDGAIIRKEDYDSLLLWEGAEVEFIRFVGGG